MIMCLIAGRLPSPKGRCAKIAFWCINEENPLHTGGVNESERAIYGLSGY